METDWGQLKELAERAALAGDFADAEALWFAALHTVEFEGETDPRWFATLDGLASACALQLKYDQAENLYWDAIRVKEQHFGVESLETAQSLKGLAAVYYERGQYAQAEVLGKRIFTIFERAYGADSKEVGEIALNLATVSQKQKKGEQSQFYYQRAMDIKNKTGNTGSKVVTPFSSRTAKPTSVCKQCNRTYVGDHCMKCTQTALKALEKPVS